MNAKALAGRISTALRSRLYVRPLAWFYSIRSFARRLGLKGVPAIPERGGLVFDATGGVGEWAYQDERWEEIQHRWKRRASLLRGGRVDAKHSQQDLAGGVSLDDGVLRVAREPQRSDEWVYVYVQPDQGWQSYVWDVAFSIGSPLKEFQLVFRYVDFHNRFRYRFQGGYVYFDMVLNGQFYPALSVAHYPLVLNRNYDCAVVVDGDSFELWVDGVLLCRDFDHFRRLSGGTIAVVFWEDDGLTPIVGTVTRSRVALIGSRP